MTNLVVMHGIGYVPDGSTLVSATPADYVAEIERLERALAAAKVLLDERIALSHPLTAEPTAEPDLALDRDGPYCDEHLNDVRAWCAECTLATNERRSMNRTGDA